ncbi:hotdog fold thioesterase [Nakamurella sp. YIM 132087]|uniref:Hotdog fold thioesterase n=1 Tax=Nakamurella alba TaxID=2665158 RepID=A0A7K1FNE6_9ACTN|nr:PaaI family thioesterase [Nakamurella alba]MTD15691.1 hotdog fold thioesterase [Nakamurella alba]
MSDQPAVPARSKTVSWADPADLALRGRDLSGLDFLRSMMAGDMPPPPIAQLMGFTVQRVDPGEVVFGCLPDESVYNPIGVVHGGLVCTLLDTVTACAVHTTLAAGVAYTSLEIKVNYLRPVRAGAELTAHGWVTKPGRRAAFAEGDVRDAAGTVLATASSTCLVMGPA